MATKISRVIFAAVLSLFIADVHAMQGQTTAGSCSPSVGTQNANSSIVISCSYGGSSVQDSYLIATHPTRVKITGALFTTWVEDNSAPFLSLEFTNDSDLPALSTKIDVLRQESAEAFTNMKPYAIHRSRIFRQLDANSFSIDAKSTITLPIVSIEDLASMILPQVPRDYCAYDASIGIGTDPDEQKARTDMLERESYSLFFHPESRGTGKAEFANLLQVPVLMRIRFKNVFGGQSSQYTKAFVYYAQRGSTASIWYPTTKKLGPLQCIGDDSPHFTMSG
ncbi:hypothetical protein [Luteibacter sp. 9135]|uniref:hypothetical protein n=1 Tax=Luteibacter sp. 9135 TaxID=1500893 RepID=UPI00163A383A|nr:hypothetical protein [Luteibacter sp. 9135]